MSNPDTPNTPNQEELLDVNEQRKYSIQVLDKIEPLIKSHIKSMKAKDIIIKKYIRRSIMPGPRCYKNQQLLKAKKCWVIKSFAELLFEPFRQIGIKHTLILVKIIRNNKKT
jgi:hypothetical protein